MVLTTAEVRKSDVSFICCSSEKGRDRMYVCCARPDLPVWQAMVTAPCLQHLSVL